MKRLKVWHRLGLLFLVMLSTNVISLILLNSDKNEAIRTIEKERDGLVYLEPVRQLRQWLPAYRQVAETNPKLLDRVANPPSLLNVEKAMGRLDELDRKWEHELSTTEDFVGLKRDWSDLQKSISNRDSVRKTYEKANTRLRALIAVAGDSSGLVLDNVLESYYLINVVVTDLPNEDDLLNNLLDSAGKDANQFLIMGDVLKRGLSDANSHLDVAMHADPDLTSLDAQKHDHEMKIQALLTYLAANKPGSAEYVSAVQAAKDENFKLYDAVAPVLDRVLQKRSGALQADKRGTLELILLLSLLALGLAVWIGQSIVGPIRHATQLLKSPEGAHITMASTNTDEVSRLIEAATTKKAPVISPSVSAQSANEALREENQRLKDLVVELTLENRSGKSKGARAD